MKIGIKVYKKPSVTIIKTGTPQVVTPPKGNPYRNGRTTTKCVVQSSDQLQDFTSIPYYRPNEVGEV